jgi:1,4-dihydroxy-2-naphthoyl-CoA synthase
MKRMLRAVAVLTICLFAGWAVAGGLSFHTASGTVSKAAADALTIQPRGPEGKFGKSLLLKVTGTSKVTVLSKQKRAGKLVFVQREIDAKDLEAGQHVAVIYTTETKGNVLLSAVALPSTAK